MTDTTDTARLAKELRELAHKIDPGPAAAHYVLLHDCAGRLSALAAENAAMRMKLDAAMSTIHDEMQANLALRESGGALPDEDMPTFCARLVRDAGRWRKIPMDHILHIFLEFFDTGFMDGCDAGFILETYAREIDSSMADGKDDDVQQETQE